MGIRKLIIAGCVLVAVGSIGILRARAIAQQAPAALPVAELIQPAPLSATASGTIGELYIVPGVASVPANPTSSLFVASAPLVSGESGDAKVWLSKPASQAAFIGVPSSVSEDEQFETWVSLALSTYAQTEDQDARAKQRDEIAKGLDQIFDIRQEQRINELKALEARVQKLRSTLDQRAASKNDILKNRLDYLLREADGLGWGDGIPGPSHAAVSGAAAAGFFSTNPARAATSSDPFKISAETSPDVLNRSPENPDSPRVQR